MPEFAPEVFEIAVPVLAGLLYAIIWYATRGLPRLAKVLARVLPLVVIVPAVLYFSLGMPSQREEARQATSPRKAKKAVRRDGGTAPTAEERPEVATSPAPTSSAPPPAPVTARPPPPQQRPRLRPSPRPEPGPVPEIARTMPHAVLRPAFLPRHKVTGTWCRCSTGPTARAPTR